jgi:hypothetical protein
LGVVYSSTPSWRFRIWLDSRIVASASRSVTSYSIAARWRSGNDTIRRDRTRTRLPDGVRHTSSRTSTPSRKSSTREYASSSASLTTSGSSSTYRRTTFASGTLTIVWPTRAKPKASSAWRIGHVSWKPFTNVPFRWPSRPSSMLPRIPR